VDECLQADIPSDELGDSAARLPSAIRTFMRFAWPQSS
jgi:hypothetical protein